MCHDDIQADGAITLPADRLSAAADAVLAWDNPTHDPEDLWDVLSDYGWVTEGPNSEVQDTYHIWYQGKEWEKWDHILAAIAPFVTEGAVECRGNEREDLWMFLFQDGKLYKIPGQVEYQGLNPARHERRLPWPPTQETGPGH